jgi:hypothetical protein
MGPRRTYRPSGGRTALTVNIDKDFLEELLTRVIKIEKRFAHELTGAKNDRRAEIKETVSKMVAEKLDR